MAGRSPGHRAEKSNYSPTANQNRIILGVSIVTKNQSIKNKYIQKCLNIFDAVSGVRTKKFDDFTCSRPAFVFIFSSGHDVQYLTHVFLV